MANIIRLSKSSSSVAWCARNRGGSRGPSQISDALEEFWMTTTLDNSGLPSRTPLPFLDREHTIARPGYSRWMVPPAALCVHLCIGQAYAFSVFNLPMTRLLGVSQSTPARLEAHRTRLDFLDRDGLSRLVRRGLRPLGRGRRAPQGDVHRRHMLGKRVPGLGARRLPAQSLDHLSRLRRDRRLRARHRLHLAGLDLDEMVSRPPGHGHGDGDHGLRRRRADRLAAVGVADGQVSTHPTSACSTPSSRLAASISSS